MLTSGRILIGVLLWIVPLAAHGQETPPAPLKVLFIGNNYTSVTTCPLWSKGWLICRWTEDRSGSASCRRLHIGEHVKDQKAIDKIRSDKWDIVVLQEQSLRPVVSQQSMHQYGRLLDAEIKQQGHKTVFYLTWARQHILEMQEGADPVISPEYAQGHVPDRRRRRKPRISRGGASSKRLVWLVA